MAADDEIGRPVPFDKGYHLFVDDALRAFTQFGATGLETHKNRFGYDRLMARSLLPFAHGKREFRLGGRLPRRLILRKQIFNEPIIEGTLRIDRGGVGVGQRSSAPVNHIETLVDLLIVIGASGQPEYARILFEPGPHQIFEQALNKALPLFFNKQSEKFLGFHQCIH